MPDHYTANFEKIRTWIEDHGGFPARIKGVTSEEYDRPDYIEISFDPRNTDLERISWDELFVWIEHNNLALRYGGKDQDDLGLFEFVDRERVTDELARGTDLPDSGDPDVLSQNITPDAE